MSAGPPTANGTMILTGRAGYSCACAAIDRQAATSAARAKRDIRAPPWSSTESTAIACRCQMRMAILSRGGTTMKTCMRCGAMAWAAALAALPCDAGAAVADVLAQATIPISQARPNTGSRIRRELPKLTIPATDPYDKLTLEQMRAFRALFTSLADTDEPPYPADGLLPIAKALVFALADGAIGEG